MFNLSSYISIKSSASNKVLFLTIVKILIRSSFKFKIMRLSQALKQKNRLAGELVRLQQILQRENSRRSDNLSKIDCSQIFNQIIQISDELGELKGKIATANIGIYTKLERMAELKSRIGLLKMLNVREGEDVNFVGRDQEKLVYTWTAFINQEKADKLIAELQTAIDTLQDEVDQFNATTEI